MSEKTAGETFLIFAGLMSCVFGGLAAIILVVSSFEALFQARNFAKIAAERKCPEEPKTASQTPYFLYYPKESP